jgi:hypothetical protein
MIQGISSMGSWKSYLHADATKWLLDDSNPSVRYFTLRDVVDKPPTKSELTEVKSYIMRHGAVPEILQKQTDKSYWGEPDRFYRMKYKGTVWQLMILAELGADGNNDCIQNACEFILSHSQDVDSGGFSHSGRSQNKGGRHCDVIPCLTGNMVWSLICFGYLQDSRLQRGIEWITRFQRFDDGESTVLKGWPYDRLKTGCFSKHSCHMGVVKTLKALAEIPEHKRSAAVKKTITKGAEYLLIHHVFKSSHNLDRVPKPGWLRFGFPLMYQTDALEILWILTKLGYHDLRMQEAIDVVVSKQNSTGTWNLENTFNGRYQVNIENKGQPSKWITLHALQVLKRFYGKK